MCPAAFVCFCMFTQVVIWGAAESGGPGTHELDLREQAAAPVAAAPAAATQHVSCRSLTTLKHVASQPLDFIHLRYASSGPTTLPRRSLGPSGHFQRLTRTCTGTAAGADDQVQEASSCRRAFCCRLRSGVPAFAAAAACQAESAPHPLPRGCLCARCRQVCL